jgi:phage terminase large subunit-like protein
MMSNARALYAVNFIESLCHTKGSFAGKPFQLLPWQHEVMSDIYGTLNERGRRQFNYIYLEVPKKMGKSELGAAVALYHTFADGEQHGEIYSCAADRQQASFVFDVAFDMVEQNPILKGRCRPVISQKTMIDKQTGSVYKALSAEAYTKHGVNLSACVFDELHTQPNRQLYDTMIDGSGDARLEPLWFFITTAGDDPDRKSVAWSVHQKAQNIIDGTEINPFWYCRIWGIPQDYEGDIWDEALWYKVNPSLGHTIEIDAVRRQALEARNDPVKERNFRWLRLNQWVSLKRLGWLPITMWDTTVRDWSPADLLGKKCYVGIDLSSKIDLTAAVPLFPPQEGFDDWRFLINAWVPEDNMKEREHRDHVPYGDWVKSKHLNATPGDVVDYGFIKNHIEKMEMQYNVQYYCGDPWHLEILRQLMPYEIQSKFIEISQLMAGMSPAMGELERLFRSGLISHEKNPLGRWTFGNVIVATDGNENTKPMKNRSLERIDPIVALVDAMAGAIKMEPKRSVYEERGMRAV